MKRFPAVWLVVIAFAIGYAQTGSSQESAKQGPLSWSAFSASGSAVAAATVTLRHQGTNHPVYGNPLRPPGFRSRSVSLQTAMLLIAVLSFALCAPTRLLGPCGDFGTRRRVRVRPGWKSPVSQKP